MRVLVIEDEPLTLEFLKRSLKAENHLVDIASDGAEGFKEAISMKHELVILDVILPSMNGLDVCKQLREAGFKTPIIILSSQDRQQARIDGLDAGADDYLIKPFNLEELLARMRAVSRRPTKILPTTMKIADIELNPVKNVVKRAGKKVMLRPKEFSLLEYLMRNADQALSRKEILQKVWGIGVGNTSNRLDVYILHLRQKIDKNRKPGLIQTVRGKGYMIKTP